MNTKNKMTPVMIDKAKTALRNAYYLEEYAISHEMHMDGSVYIINFETEAFARTPGHHIEITIEVSSKELDIRMMGMVNDKTTSESHIHGLRNCKMHSKIFERKNKSWENSGLYVSV